MTLAKNGGVYVQYPPLAICTISTGAGFGDSRFLDVTDIGSSFSFDTFHVIIKAINFDELLKLLDNDKLVDENKLNNNEVLLDEELLGPRRQS